MRRQIGYIGLGKLGLPCAEVLGQMHDVVGFDIQSGSATHFRRASTLAEAVRHKSLVFVVVPTPHLPEYDGSLPTSDLPPRDFDYSILKQVLADVAVHLTPAQKVVVVSTVLPGTCRRELELLLPPASLLYSPSFVAMGSVRNDFLNPDIVVIGTHDGEKASAADLAELYGELLNSPRLHAGTWEEAESIKIFYNTFISLKIAFANMIQDVAERLGNLDVDRVTAALIDARGRIISGAYLRAGMGDGGPCHPRDNIALRALAERLDLGYDLFSELLRCREKQAENLARFLVSFEQPVAIVGKSYKPGVPYTDGSSSVLVAHFVEQFGQFLGFIDPLAGEQIEECEALTYLLAHDSPELHRHKFFPKSVIVDPWRSCPAIEGCEVIRYGNRRSAFNSATGDGGTRRSYDRLHI
jgi:UDPglucose 6-dehydrogenase